MTTKDVVLNILADGKPKTAKELVLLTGLSDKAIGSVLSRLWKSGFILRTDKPISQHTKTFKGRGGMKLNMRNFHLYMFKPKDTDELFFHGRTYVAFSEEYLDARGKKGKSKSSMILDFLRKNQHKAFYSVEVYENLKDMGIKQNDVSHAIRRFEKQGLLYRRGYRTGEKESPFPKGFIAVYLNQNVDRKEAIKEAIEKTNKVLLDKPSQSPIVERIRTIRDTIIGSTELRELVSQEFLQNKLQCNESNLRYSIKRALQLYPDLKMVKLFDLFPHFYHSSMNEEDLNASIELRKNFIRKTGGRSARLGHNWESAVGWFIDEFTDAEFMTQKHRNKRMDPRRITIHLIKPTAGRRFNAEIDRVWKITPSIFSKSITYCLECKWGVVMKKHLDGFLSVLKNSKEFGTDTEKGREIMAGVIPVFAGGTFNPREKVYLENGAIDLTTYASRMNIQLLRASDFNRKLEERGVNIKKCSVEKICRYCADEKEVREILAEIWKKPKEAEEILGKVMEKNRKVYELEKLLEA